MPPQHQAACKDKGPDAFQKPAIHDAHRTGQAEETRQAYAPSRPPLRYMSKISSEVASTSLDAQAAAPPARCQTSRAARPGRRPA